MNRTVLASLLVAVAVTSLFATLYATGFINLPFGPSTTKTPKTTFRTANTTATNQLMINSTKPAIQSVSVQDCNLSTVTLGNVRFPSNWAEVAVNASESCSVIVNLSYPSSYNVTFSGISNGVAWSSGGDGQLTIYTNFKVTNAQLALDVYSFNSSTNVTMNIRNSGTATGTLISYNVTDSNRNTWTRTSWSGPTIAPNAMVPTSILIGSSCPSCTYTGTANAFNGFNPGYSYTVTIIISTNQPFRFPILR